MSATSDRIEQHVVITAPPEKVWNAISDSREFGRWFGARFDGPFAPGMKLTGKIVPTTVDPDIAALQKPFEGSPMEILVDRIEPMRLLAFRWHPGAGQATDVSLEPETLVEFIIRRAPVGTELVIYESGFDRLPPDRRREAYAGNAEGWSKQAMLISRYVTAEA